MKNFNEKILEIVRNTNLVPFLKGPHGIGKTTLVKDLAKSLNKSLTIFNLSAVDSSDLTGLPLNEKSESGLLLKYSRPSLLDYDIIFLDELDRVRSNDVKASLLSLFIDRSINGHRLRQDTILISAGNYDSNNYETTEFDPALLDRIVFLNIDLKVPDRIDYFKKELGQKNIFTLFIESRPILFDSFSPRRLFQTASLFKDRDVNELNISLVENILDRETKRLFETFINDGLISLEDLISGEIKAEKLSVLSRTSCTNLILNGLSELVESSQDLTNLAEFILELSPEEKANYFSSIKSMLIDSKISKSDLITLNEKNLFKGQKTFLKELI